MDEIVLTGIAIYPLKSGAGVDLDAREVEACGLRGDRRWMVIDADGVCVTARERPQLVRVRAEIAGPGLRLGMDGGEPLDVRYPEPGSRAARVWIWGQACSALDAGDSAARWISEALDKPVRLVAMDDDVKRRPDPECTLAEDEVSFADCYPVLAIGRSSLDDLNTRTPAPVSMRRFRPNFVVTGGTPYVEDHWRRIRIGSVEFEGGRTANGASCRPSTRTPASRIRSASRCVPLPAIAAAPPARYFWARTWCRAALVRSGSAIGWWCWSLRIEDRPHASPASFGGSNAVVWPALR